MIRKMIRLKKDTKDSDYTKFCNWCEEKGIFVACGSPDGKWIMVQFED